MRRLAGAVRLGLREPEKPEAEDLDVKDEGLP